MVLSAHQIHEAIKNKSILIEPFNPNHLNGASYTFILSNKLKKITKLQTIKSKMIVEFEEFKIPKCGYELKSGEFVVLQTKEHINLKGTYVCLLSTRSSLAQAGLDVIQSSSFAEPDTNNSFALEVTNHGPITIIVYPGMKIVKGIFFRLVT